MRTMTRSWSRWSACVVLAGCAGSSGKTATSPPATDPADDSGETGAEVSLELVDLEAGEFFMGVSSTTVPGADPGSAPTHVVSLSAFSISATEVTNTDYLAFLQQADAQGLLEVVAVTERWPDGSEVTHDWVYGSASSDWADQPLVQLSDAGGVSSEGGVEHADNRSWLTYTASNGFSLVDTDKANWPVTWVKWYGAAAFADFYDWALPTEAQWEYAAGCDADGGHSAEYATASGLAVATEANWNGDVPNVANHDGHVVAVKTYPPNPCGLYEMSGNAWEWVADWYGGAPYYEATDGSLDPINTAGIDPETASGSAEWVEGEESTYRVRRGGSWNYHTATITAWGRGYDFPQRGNNHFGFRVTAP